MRSFRYGLICAISCLLHAQAADKVALGSGHRGLVFTQLSVTHPDEKVNTMALACNLSPGFPIDVSYPCRGSATQILVRDTFSEEYMNTFPSNYWSGGITTELYSFGKDMATNGKSLYRVENGHIRIDVGAAQREARNQYGLKEDQIFLGAFEQRVFYWIRDHPREVYFATRGRTYRYLLHERVTKLLGMAKGDPKGDLALKAVVKPAVGWYPSPRTFEWIILGLKDAMPADGLGVGLSDTRTSPRLSVRMAR